MSMHRTIVISLACLMISVGAVAETPEKSASQNSSQLRAAKPAETGPADQYLSQVRPLGPAEFGTAAWYNWVGGRTASGEILDAVTPTAAHRSLPLASYAKVTNLDTGRSVIVKINDRGPWKRRFIIDLSPRAAAALDVIRRGIATVVVEPIALGPGPSGAARAIAAYQTSGATAVQ